MIIRVKKRARRLGLTLVELLITMAIISILASIVLFTMTTAQQSAREAKTRSMIATLDGLLMERYESYRTRRVAVNTSSISDPTDRNEQAILRLNGIRRLMQLEMPERWVEVNFNQSVSTNYEPLSQLPTLSKMYKRRYDADSPSPVNQGAETLYLVITLACGDGEALEHFSQSDIGDTDGDGAPEFLDGWGNPISWLRWPAGFVSERQPMPREPSEDHDPFDPMRVDSTAYRLVPLVYSAGSDGDFDVVAHNEDQNFGYVIEGTPALLDPYTDSAEGFQIGTMADTDSNFEGWHDNIHNHLLGTR